MDLKELRKQYGEKVARMEALAEAAKKENRGLSEDEGKEFDAVEVEVKNLKRNIERAEVLAREQEERGRATTSPIDIQVTRGEGEDEKGKCVVYSTFGEQLRDVAALAKDPYSANTSEVRKRVDLANKITRAASGHSEAVAADGGALVITDFASEILDKAYLLAPFASKVKRYGLTSGANGIKIPYVDETSRADGSRQGGIRAYWEEEAAAYTATKGKFGLMELNLKKLIGAAYITDELLGDAGVLGSWVTQAFQREFAFKLDDAFINGDGAGKPSGILNSSALVSVAKEVSQTAATINANNLAKMLARVPEANLPGCIWLYNQAAKAQLMTLGLTVGSNSYPVMLQGGITGNMMGGVPVNTVLGIPAFASEHCAALGTVNDIILVDTQAYIAIDKGGIKSAQSVHVRFLYDENCFKFTYRVDGQPAWRTGLTPFKGSDTLSPYVVVATRA